MKMKKMFLRSLCMAVALMLPTPVLASELSIKTNVDVKVKYTEEEMQNSTTLGNGETITLQDGTKVKVQAGSDADSGIQAVVVPVTEEDADVHSYVADMVKAYGEKFYAFYILFYQDGKEVTLSSPATVTVTVPDGYEKAPLYSFTGSSEAEIVSGAAEDGIWTLTVSDSCYFAAVLPKGEEPEPTATPTPGEEPEATVTPTPGEEPEATVTPTPGEEPEATVTPTPGENPEGTVTPTPGEGPELTATPTPGEEPEGTVTPTPGEEPELTATPTPGEEPEPSATPTPGENPEASATPTPGENPEPSATPTPGENPEATVTPTPGEEPELTATPTPGASGTNQGTGSGTGGTSGNGTTQGTGAQTGDETNLALWLCMCVGSAMVLAAYAIRRKAKNRTHDGNA